MNPFTPQPQVTRFDAAPHFSDLPGETHFYGFIPVGFPRPDDADTPAEGDGQECEAMRWEAMDGDGEETPRAVQFWNRVMAEAVLLLCTLAISCAVISAVRYWGIAQ